LYDSLWSAIRIIAPACVATAPSFLQIGTYPSYAQSELWRRCYATQGAIIFIALQSKSYSFTGISLYIIRLPTTRIKINKLLEAAGWRFFDNVQGKANILLENNAKITKKQWNEWGDNFEKTTQGFIDYLLFSPLSF